MMAEDLYFVVVWEDDQWVAHGIQHDLVAYADTLRDLKARIQHVVNFQHEKGTMHKIPRAHAKYWELLGEALKAGRTLDSGIKEEDARATALVYDL